MYKVVRDFVQQQLEPSPWSIASFCASGNLLNHNHTLPALSVVVSQVTGGVVMVDTLEVVAVAAPPPAVESGRVVEVEGLALSRVRADTAE